MKFRIPEFTWDPYTVNKNGVYNLEDYKKTREKTDILQVNCNESFMNLLLKGESSKVVAAGQLSKIFDFKKYTGVLELGAGEMIPSLTLKTLNPHLHYTATDFDPDLIERMKQVPLLKNINKKVFDAKTDSFTAMTNETQDLILCWGLEYLLTDQQIINLLGSLKSNGADLLIITPTMAQAKQLLSYAIRKPRYNRAIKQQQCRMHGYSRSLGYLKHLAKQSKAKITHLEKSGPFDFLLISPQN